MSNGQDPIEDDGKLVVTEYTFVVSGDDIEPPPPHSKSKFKTLEEWLANMCDSDTTQTSIETYKIALFESQNNYLLTLVGVNTIKEGNVYASTYIAFAPANRYFRLPKPYLELTREDLLNKLTKQLKAFTETDTFKLSFLLNAHLIIFETNGQIIWSKP